MRIAIASGKGGAGKTTIATTLAVAAAARGRATVYVDCDVEAPNGHLLLRPRIEHRHAVSRLVPVVDRDRCDGCGACGRACQFGAIVCVGGAVVVYPNLCKSCGACLAACDRGAIGEAAQMIGVVETGCAGALRFVQGVLDVGQARCIPVIDAAKAAIGADDELVVIDAPPGTSCPMVAAVRGSDLVILVAEPTPFGLADLTIAADALRLMGLPAAVVINRSDVGDQRVRRFCDERGLPVIAEVPYSQALAQAYASGDLAGIGQALGAAPQRLLQWIDDHAPARSAS